MTQQVILANTAAARPAAVIDTNVLLDLLVFQDLRALPLRQALDAGRLTWLATAPMCDELDIVLARSLTQQWGTTPEAVRSAARCWWVPAEVPPPGVAWSALRCTDASDQKFIDLAVVRSVPWLLTHDRALLRLRRAAARRGVAVLTPQAWAAAAQVGPQMSSQAGAEMGAHRSLPTGTEGDAAPATNPP